MSVDDSSKGRLSAPAKRVRRTVDRPNHRLQDALL